MEIRGKSKLLNRMLAHILNPNPRFVKGHFTYWNFDWETVKNCSHSQLLKIKGKVLFIYLYSKNWQKKSVHHHLLTNDGAHFFFANLYCSERWKVLYIDLLVIKMAVLAMFQENWSQFKISSTNCQQFPKQGTEHFSNQFLNN